MPSILFSTTTSDPQKTYMTLSITGAEIFNYAVNRTIEHSRETPDVDGGEKQHKLTLTLAEDKLFDRYISRYASEINTILQAYTRWGVSNYTNTLTGSGGAVSWVMEVQRIVPTVPLYGLDPNVTYPENWDRTNANNLGDTILHYLTCAGLREWYNNKNSPLAQFYQMEIDTAIDKIKSLLEMRMKPVKRQYRGM